MEITNMYLEDGCIIMVIEGKRFILENHADNRYLMRMFQRHNA